MGFGWDSGEALQANLRQTLRTNLSHANLYEPTYSVMGRWSTPLNAYEQWDKRYETVDGFIRAYEQKREVTPGCRAYDNGEREYTQRGYLLVPMPAWDETVKRWNHDTFYLTEPVSGSSELCYVACWRFDGHPDPAYDDGIDPHLVLHPVWQAEGYSMLSPRKFHHLHTEWEDIIRHDPKP